MAKYFHTFFNKLLQLTLIYGICIHLSLSNPQPGKWLLTADQSHILQAAVKTLYRDSQIYIAVNCEAQKDTMVDISYVVRKVPGYFEVDEFDEATLKNLVDCHENPSSPCLTIFELCGMTSYFQSKVTSVKCDKSIQLEPEKSDFHPAKRVVVLPGETGKAKTKEAFAEMLPNPVARRKRSTNDSAIKSDASVETPATNSSTHLVKPKKSDPFIRRQPQLVVPQDGIYILTVMVKPGKDTDSYNASIDVQMMGSTGNYLSAVDWPLLPFYGAMCLVYVIYGMAWLTVSALQWRDLLRIQFWIGGVILLGMLEKAVFYAEFQSVNSTGLSAVKGATLFAEFVSCLKRTLARMLIIIVSLGYGIVKPRLGSVLQRVVGIGFLYFVLSTVESFLRITKTKSNQDNMALIASIPLAVLDSAICWWIFSSLVQTTRTLRLRRNLTKLALYRHFTNTLIFAVIASIAFMVWSIKSHKLADCKTDWKELWVDDAYWHLLFSVILLVIMILWRPTNNNQRYAFTPLLDAADDDDEDTEYENCMNEAFDGVKIRNLKSEREHSKPKEKGTVDEELKWIEENIPSSVADAALPSLLDSDEEIMTTRFEISKME